MSRLNDHTGFVFLLNQLKKKLGQLWLIKTGLNTFNGVYERFDEKKEERFFQFTKILIDQKNRSIFIH